MTDQHTPEKIDRLGGSLVNIILGALILWVGQTTYRHAGELSGIKQTFKTVDQKITSVDSDYDQLRDRFDKNIVSVNKRTESRFTQQDGKELTRQLQELNRVVTNLERQLVDRIYTLRSKVSSIESHGNRHLELTSLREDLKHLQIALAQQGPYAPHGVRHTLLPPVHVRR